MNTPQPIRLEIRPSLPGICTGAATELDVLVRVMPPEVDATAAMERPKLNVGLVIDRSGSMGGQKIDYARQAAIFAIEQFRADDRVSITVFDDRVDVPVPSTPAADKALLRARIRGIQVGGSTALHAGWVEGATQVGAHLERERLNRVILFTDGIANVGETNPDRIATDAHGLARRDISTTTLGIGADYNEDLLEAMARSGDGNYYFIESPEQLPRIFAAELRGLLATLGRSVSLGIEPAAGVEVLDVYNDMERNVNGRLVLPNLIAGQPIEVALRLRVNADAAPDTPVCGFRLAWRDPKLPERLRLRTHLKLPAVSAGDFAKMPADPDVASAVAVLQANRLKQSAVDSMAEGDYAGAMQKMSATRQYVTCSPASPMAAAAAMEDLNEIEARIASGDTSTGTKLAKEQIYRARRGKKE